MVDTAHGDINVTTPCSCGHMAILHDRTDTPALTLNRCQRCECPAFIRADDARLAVYRAVFGRVLNG